MVIINITRNSHRKGVSDLLLIYDHQPLYMVHFPEKLHLLKPGEGGLQPSSTWKNATMLGL